MSGEDNFIARWSRLKQEAAQGKAADAEAQTPEREPRDAPPTPAGEASGAHPQADPPFDPATLPPIDSIVADSDIRAFLQKGVPAALTKAALRRAWSTDPAIRDFIEVAENQWDFTNPTTIPGFGDLDATDLHKLIAQAMGKLSDAPDPVGLWDEGRGAGSSDRPGEAPEPPASDDAPEIPPEISVVPEISDVDIAVSQHAESASDIGAPSRKGHGRALPQ